MPDILTFQRKQSLIPNVDVGAFLLQHPPFTTPTTGIANGDYIRLFAPARRLLVCDAWVNVSATLGAGATVRLVRNRNANYTNLTPATTAGGASLVTFNVAPIEVDITDTLELLVGGANITAAAAIAVTVLGQTL